MAWPMIEASQVAFGSENEADAWTTPTLQCTCGDKRRLLRRGGAGGCEKQASSDGGDSRNARHQNNSGLIFRFTQ